MSNIVGCCSNVLARRCAELGEREKEERVSSSDVNPIVPKMVIIS